MQRTLVRKDFSVKGRSDIKINNSTNKQINRPRKEKQKKNKNKQTNKQTKQRKTKKNKQIQNKTETANQNPSAQYELIYPNLIIMVCREIIQLKLSLIPHSQLINNNNNLNHYTCISEPLTEFR
jgi:hypothetical protein